MNDRRNNIDTSAGFDDLNVAAMLCPMMRAMMHPMMAAPMCAAIPGRRCCGYT